MGRDDQCGPLRRAQGRLLEGHDLAEEIADRIGIIHNGRLIGIGTVDEIKRSVEESDRLEDVFLKITAEE